MGNDRTALLTVHPGCDILIPMNNITRASGVVFTLVAGLLTGGLASPSASADPPKGPALDTSFLKLYAETRGFMLGRPQKPKVTPDGKSVLFLRSEAKVPKLKLYEFDIASQKTREILSPELILKGADENVSPEEKARRERQRISVGGFADYHLNTAGTHVLVKLSNTLYVLDRATGKVQELKAGKDGAIVDPKWSPDGKRVGYVRGFDVYAYDLATDKETAVTTGGTQIKTHGLAEFVAQEEMGRFSGFWWSPDSKFIAYEEADHTGVEQWFVADPLKPDVPPTPQYYPRPGKKNVSVRLGIKPVEGGETVWIEWDRNIYEYLARVGWSKTELLLVLQTRNQSGISYQHANPATGKTRGWFTAEQAAKPTQWANLPPDWLTLTTVDSVVILLYSSGERQFGLHFAGSPTGKSVLLTTAGAADEVLGVDEKRLAFIVTGPAPGDPTQRHLYQMIYREEDGMPGPPDGFVAGGVRLTPEVGVHTATVSTDGTLAAITSTTLVTMPHTRVQHTEVNGQNFGTLPSVATEPPFVPNVTVQKIGDYYTAIVRPKDFDPKKKYPVIVDVYGGPKHLHVVQAMRNWLVPQWLADQGFIVVAIENRGTPGRGLDWEKAIYQKFGTVPLEDQVKGLQLLCDKYPELDRQRVGIVGWSFGGYMTANGVLRRPDVFKAAVAGAPVTDWEDYDTHYTERYMGLLPESKAAYDEASLIPLAGKLERPLLLVHGTADDNVYYRHTLKLSDALFRAGRDFEALALPGVTHMYSADPVVMERLWAKTARFFKQHLGEPK
jgi:dipeptidyl-peptidase-4